MRVEVTLKSGVTVTGYASTFEVTSDGQQGPPRTASWEGRLEVGQPAFRYINLEEVAAVTIFPESSDLAGAIARPDSSARTE